MQPLGLRMHAPNMSPCVHAHCKARALHESAEGWLCRAITCVWQTACATTALSAWSTFLTAFAGPPSSHAATQSMPTACRLIFDSVCQHAWHCAQNLIPWMCWGFMLCCPLCHILETSHAITVPFSPVPYTGLIITVLLICAAVGGTQI